MTYTNLKKIITSLLLILSLFVGIITVPSFNSLSASEGGVKLPSDDFNEGDFDNADFFPYYNQLSEKEKNVYKIMVENISNGVSKFYFAKDGENDKALLEEEFDNVLRAIYYEHPELYWFGSVEEKTVAFTSNSDGYDLKDAQGNYVIDHERDRRVKMYTGTEVVFNRYADDLEATKATFKSKVEEILAPTKNMTDAEKVYYIHNKLCELISYDYQGIEDENLDSSVYGVLTKGEAVCQGYVRTLQYLLQVSGVPAQLVIGDAYSNIRINRLHNGEVKIEHIDKEAHAWNLVKVGDHFYNVDLTWDDIYREKQTDNVNSYIKFNYFMVDDEYEAEISLTEDGDVHTTNILFNTSHIRSANCDFLPECDTVFDFEGELGLTREEAFVENFDKNEVDTIVNSLDEYITLEKYSVFTGTQGDVTFTPNSVTGKVDVSGTMKESGEKLVDYYNSSSDFPWSKFHNIVEPVTKTFIVTDGDLFDDILDLDRTDLLNSVYSQNISFTGYMYSVRYTSFYELQNGCYLVEISPDIYFGETKEITNKKANIIELSPLQKTIDVTKGQFIDFSDVEMYVYYNDFSKELVDIDKLYESNFNYSQLGEQRVNVTYKCGDKMAIDTVQLKVNVVSKDPSTYTLGDVDGDGNLTSNDAFRVLMYSMFQKDGYSVNQGVDFNGDGRIDSDDAIRLLMHYAFPEEQSYELKY